MANTPQKGFYQKHLLRNTILEAVKLDMLGKISCIRPFSSTGVCACEKAKNIEGLYIILSRINSISTSYNPHAILLTFGLLTTLVLLTTLLFVNLRNYRPALFFGPIKVSPKNIGFHHHFTCQ